MKSINSVEKCVCNSELLEILDQKTKYSKVAKTVLHITDEDFLKFLFESKDYHDQMIKILIINDNNIDTHTKDAFHFYKIACQYIDYVQISYVLTNIFFVIFYKNKEQCLDFKQINDIMLYANASSDDIYDFAEDIYKTYFNSGLAMYLYEMNLIENKSLFIETLIKMCENNEIYKQL